MATFNKVILVGNLTRDPELSYTPGGSPLCKFGLALNEKYKNKQTGQDVEKVHFIDVTAWMKTAELIAQFFHKGDPILLEGKLQQDRWEDANTQQKRSKVYVTAERFSFIGSKRQGEGGGAGGDGGGQEAPAGAASGGVAEEDVPF